MKFAIILCFAGISIGSVVQAQTRTVGLLSHNPTSYDSGYVLFSPITYTATYLIDKCGRVVHTWNSKFQPGESAYLRPDGTLARSGLLTGGVQKQVSSCTEIYDWNGKLVWSYTLDSVNGQHHDFEVMPNGNLLLISHELIPNSALIAAGRDTSLISGQFFSERLVEVQPIGADSGKIVWEWRVFDHLVQDHDSSRANFGVVADHPELVNLNFPRHAVGEWLHFNSVRYNRKLDQILVSAHHSSEVWILDHSTTTAEAASHKGGKYGRGGDLLYRWGNPAAYNKGTALDQKLFGQHECIWIADGTPLAGKIMLFNNGNGRPEGLYASIDVITPPIDSAGTYSAAVLPYLPRQVDWSYTDNPPTNIITTTAGGSEMLPNGDLLVCTGQMGSMFELNPTRTAKLWKYVVPVNSAGPLTQGVVPSGNPIYKSVFYPFNYPAFAGKTIVGGSPIELGGGDYDCFVDSSLGVAGSSPPASGALLAFPNPASDALSVRDTEQRLDGVALFDMMGRRIVAAEPSDGTLSLEGVPNGVYLLVARRSDHRFESRRVTIAR